MPEDVRSSSLFLFNSFLSPGGFGLSLLIHSIIAARQVATIVLLVVGCVCIDVIWPGPTMYVTWGGRNLTFSLVHFEAVFFFFLFDIG